MTMKNPICWSQIPVNDMARAAAFYEAVFQLKLEEMPDPLGDGSQYRTFPWDPAAPGTSCMLWYRPGHTVTAGNGVTIYFDCEDCAIEAGRAAAQGGRVLTPKTPLGEDGMGFSALIEDTEGNTIGLHSMR